VDKYAASVEVKKCSGKKQMLVEDGKRGGQRQCSTCTYPETVYSILDCPPHTQTSPNNTFSKVAALRRWRCCFVAVVAVVAVAVTVWGVFPAVTGANSTFHVPSAPAVVFTATALPGRTVTVTLVPFGANPQTLACFGALASTMFDPYASANRWAAGGWPSLPWYRRCSVDAAEAAATRANPRRVVHGRILGKKSRRIISSQEWLESSGKEQDTTCVLVCALLRLAA
jgi:hypothetical protein